MNDRCWQCGKKLVLPFFAEVKDLDGNILRVHKVCKVDAERFFRPPNIGPGTQYCWNADGLLTTTHE